MALLLAGGLQRDRLNLSPTAGGQFPYLTYAEGIATEGILDHFGDRNRMPLIPTLTSLVFHADRMAFFHRATLLAVFTSTLLVAVLGLVAHRTLPRDAATLFTLLAAVTVFLPKASFVQAELAYYTGFLVTWLVSCRLLVRPSLRWSIAGGALLALTYLTKSSAGPLGLAAVGALLFRAAAAIFELGRDAMRSEPVGSHGGELHSDASSEPRASARANVPASTDSRSNVRRLPARFAISALVVGAIFLSLTSPYLVANQHRFGRYFYNVNSTFFLWCDNWAQAAAFAERHDIARGYPGAPPEQIPGPRNYWHTHSTEQIAQRVTYGLNTLAGLAIDSPWFKYVVVLFVTAGLLALGHRERVRVLLVRHAWPIGFTMGVLLAYLVAYAWYVPVAYGDRFLLSLVLPATFGLLWIGHSLSGSPKFLRRERAQDAGNDSWAVMPFSSSESPRGLTPAARPRNAALALFRSRFRAFDLMCAASSIVLLAELGLQLAGRAWAADPDFIRFYYNESRERFDAGDLAEAERGFSGVIRLDPAFVPAHAGIGLVALLEGRHDDAILALREAIRLRSNDADTHNSLGSALLSAGREEEALVAFRRAVDLAPDFATAWYNLGGTLASLDRVDDAREIVPILRRLNPRLASELVKLIE